MLATVQLDPSQQIINTENRIGQNRIEVNRNKPNKKMQNTTETGQNRKEKELERQ